MDKEFTITSVQAQAKIPVMVLQIQGDIDVTTAQKLEDYAGEAHARGAQDILLDLSEVSFISSAGLRAIHRTYQMLRQESDESPEEVKQGILDGTYKSPHLKLLCPKPDVQRSLKTAGFDMYIEMFEDRPTALASFG